MENDGQIDPIYVARARVVHWLAAIGLLALSTTVIAWWLAEPEHFGRWPADTGLMLGQMKFNVALGLLFAALALFCLLPGIHRSGRVLAGFLGIMVALLGALSLAQDIFGWQLGIDELFVRDPDPTPMTIVPGRMSANTALGFIFAGGALFSLSRGKRAGWQSSESLALLSTLPAFLALVGHGYGLYQVIGLFNTTAMSTHAAVAFLLMAAGILASSPTEGGMRWLVTRSPEGAAARILLPGSLALIAALSALSLLGRDAGLYSADTSNALLFVFGIAALFYLLTRAIARLARIEDKRRAALDALRRRDEKLRFVTDAAEVGEWDWDIVNDRLDWSEHCKEIFGLGSMAVVDYQNFLKIVHPDERERVDRAVRDAQKPDGRSYDMEFRIVRPDGQERWIHSKGKATFDANRKPIRMGGIVIDITDYKLVEETLRRERSHLQAVMDNTSALIAIRDLHGHLVLANRAVFELPGVPPSQAIQGRSIVDSLPGDVVSVLGTGSQGWGGSAPIRTERELTHRDGSRHTYLSDSFPVVEEESRQCFGICTISTDVTDLKRLENALRESGQRFRELADSAPAMLWVTGSGGEDGFVSRAWYEFTGQPQGDTGNIRDILENIHTEDIAHCRAAFDDALREYRDFECEFRVRRADGHYRWVLNKGRARRDSAGKPVGFVGSLIDITQHKEAEERVRRTALHDPLTGLPNRALVFEYGSHALAEKQRNRSKAALLFIDLDRFKPINDTYGHEAGDYVLKEVARRLLQCTRKADLLGRLGGDEFVILLSTLGNGKERDVAVARHVQDAISRPIPYEGSLLGVTPSIGIARFPEHGNDVDSLLRCADMAMYQAKQTGRANYHIYTRDLERHAEESLQVESRLRTALHDKALALHYQPVVDTGSGHLTAAEALIRLNDGGPPISPQVFIPIAESSGLINELGEWVVAEACRQQSAWQKDGLPPLTIAVNVSPLQFRQQGFAERIGDIVSQSGIDPRRLQLEVTESSVMEQVDEAIAILQRIKALGISVALDDFGTGYSSLSLLGELPLDKIKIDQAFIRRVELDQSSMAVTQAIIALAHTLELELVGEGVESESTFAYLRNSGCQQAQGYFISPPLPAENFKAWRQLH